MKNLGLLLFSETIHLPKAAHFKQKERFVCRGATITHAYLQEMRLLGLPAYAMISIGP